MKYCTVVFEIIDQKQFNNANPFLQATLPGATPTGVAFGDLMSKCQEMEDLLSPTDNQRLERKYCDK